MDSTDDLRNRILAAIQSLIVPQADDPGKNCRSRHKPAVDLELKRNQSWIRTHYHRYADYFASGHEIQPANISPVLMEVRETWQADLFRLARLTWSLPYTRGYGRRLRFLVMDDSNNKLIGVLGLQSPPLDFPARDRLFAYPEDRKVELVNQTMDIYTLGAVPPYGQLLGGKLIALTAASNKVRQAYLRKYGRRKTEMMGRELPANLVALTTTSAFGRSSIYNRLKYNSELVAQPIGFTEGYGSFHLIPIYPLLRDYLKQQGVPVRGGFGAGPRIVWQTCTRAFDRLGLPRELLKHGVEREVFLLPMIRNLKDFMEGHASCPMHFDRPFSSLAQWWHERWLMPRAERVDGWHSWDRRDIERLLMIEKTQQ